MNRTIIPDNTPPARPGLAPAPVAGSTSAGVPMAQPVPDDARDALAGALPAWDLLPATPFIRRVK